ncbi:MAG TPA: alkaline phosphatase family protein [Candidatus Binataceae bacterium]|nr:alkaline phosphatase family protein [Candidatus Binataceae bacterium]
MKHCARIYTALTLLALPILLTCYSAGALAQSPSSARPARPQHVFIIVLENEGFDTTFGPNSPAPYLSRELTKQGLLLTQYYAIGHFSLDNYIAMISGQAPNAYTQNDCFTYYDFKPLTASLDPDGQALGAGCVYPESVITLANQMEAKHLTWKGYMEDMDTNCEHPALGQPDGHIHATEQSQYATRHNPFVYFHSIIDHPTCAEHVVPMTQLSNDLSSVATTPNLAFLTPNVCHDGHDRASKLCAGGHLIAADRFLPTLVPKILHSPAYQHDGMLIITFDEADVEIKDGTVVPEKTDASACCNEPSGPNTVAPGRTGPGGGRIGALIISPYVRPGRDNQPYNHYSLLRSLEDLFGLDHLGYAAQPGLKPFSADVYSQPGADAHISN